MTLSFSISYMIIPTINFIAYQPFDLDPFLKVTQAISIMTWSNYKCLTKFTLSGAGILLAILFMFFED